MFVMVALLLVSVIGGSLLKSALAQHQMARQEQKRLQSEWLAESGLERAAANLLRNADYNGETWTISAADLKGNKEARVIITVKAVEEEQNRRQITVVADYPIDSPHRGRSRKTITVDLQKTKS